MDSHLLKKKFTHSFKWQVPDLKSSNYHPFYFTNVQNHFLLYMIRGSPLREPPREGINSIFHEPLPFLFVCLELETSYLSPAQECQGHRIYSSTMDRKNGRKRCEGNTSTRSLTELQAELPPAAASEPPLADTGETLLTPHFTEVQAQYHSCGARLFQPPPSRPQLSGTQKLSCVKFPMALTVPDDLKLGTSLAPSPRSTYNFRRSMKDFFSQDRTSC